MSDKKPERVLGTRTVDVAGCVRCGGMHPQLEFRELSKPVRTETRLGERVLYTHWAPCPINGEPVLMRVLL